MMKYKMNKIINLNFKRDFCTTTPKKMMDEGTTILAVTNATIQFMSGPFNITTLVAIMSISIAMFFSGIPIPQLGPEVATTVADAASVISDTASFTGSISSDSDIVEPLPTTAELLTNLLTTLRAQTDYLVPVFNHVITSLENTMYEINGQNEREIFLLHEHLRHNQENLRYLARNLYALLNQWVVLVPELYPILNDIRDSAQFLVNEINNLFNRTSNISGWLIAMVYHLRRRG